MRLLAILDGDLQGEVREVDDKALRVQVSHDKYTYVYRVTRAGLVQERRVP